jgi:fatty acid desaturase
MSSLFDPTPEPEDAPVDERHPDVAPEQPVARRPSVLHLVVGLVFLGLAALWALSASGAVSSDDTWLLPGLLVVAGAAGLVAALAGGRRGTR